jgi:hypothetical protein
VWLWTFIVTKALPSMFTSMGYGVYIFFASMLVLASIYAWFYIHETKGLRPDQMDHLFGFERTVTEHAQDGDSKMGGWDSDGKEAETRVERV